jgi:phage terminase large subunit-like protein
LIEFEEYFGKIVDGKIVACDKMKRISERLLEKYLAPTDYHFDADIARRHTKFIETFCKVPSGKIGQPLRLELFQKARLQAIFGFVDDNDLRQYNESIIIEGRKNGKTTETAAVEIDMLVNDKEGAPQIYNVATMLDQAKLGYNAAVKMIQQSPMLSRNIKKRTADLYFKENFGFIKALASNSNGMDGLDVHCAVIDELAAIKNRDIYDLIKQAMGARRQPLLFCITTNGFIRDSIFDAQYAYASAVIDGTIKDDRLLPFIYELDSVDEWDKPEAWIKANPGLGTIKSRDYLEQMVAKAKSDPSFKPTVMVKDFNMKQNPVTAWLRFEEIVNESTFEMSKVSHSYAIGGCDLSATTDLTCATLLIRKPKDETVYVLQHYFIPQSKIDAMEQTHSKEAPYKLWSEQGWITINEGAAVDYSKVTQWFVDMVEKYDIRPLWICYDRALSGYWVPEMEDYGFEMEKTAQGPFTWSQPMKEMGAAFHEHKVNYNNNPILRWCLANTASKALNKDGIETIQPVKIQANRRIDGMVSLLNAWVGYVKHYEEFMPYVR